MKFSFHKDRRSRGAQLQRQTGKLKSKIVLGRVHTNGPEEFVNPREVEEGGEHDVELVVTRENAAETLDSSEETLNFIAAFVEFFVVTPRTKTIRFRRNDRLKTPFANKFARGIALASLIRQQTRFA